jgi:hypothetical protein
VSAVEGLRSINWLSDSRQLRAASLVTAIPLSTPIATAPANGGVSPGVTVVDVVGSVLAGSGAPHAVLWLGGSGTKQSVTLWGATDDDDDVAGVPLSMLARDSDTKVPVNEAASAEGLAPPLLAAVAEVPDVSPEEPAGDAIEEAFGAAGVVVDVVVVADDGEGGMAYLMLGGVPSNALTMVGSVPPASRAHVPTPPSPYWRTRRAICYIEVGLSKKVSCHWLPI